MLDVDTCMFFFRSKHGNRSNAGCALPGFLGKTEHTGCGRRKLGMEIPFGGYDTSSGGKVI